MNRIARILIGSVFATFAFTLAAGPALAAKIDADLKVLFENDKVRVIETTWKPGAESESLARGNRVARAMKGGTLTRIYPDGKKEKITYKDGEVKWVDATPAYTIKNETKSTIKLYTVFVK